VVLVGAAIYVITIAQVVKTTIILNEPENQYKVAMDNLGRLIQHHSVPPHLARILREYFIHCRSLQKLHYQQQTLLRMSPMLRKAVATHINMGWIAPVNFLTSCATSGERKTFIVAIALALRGTAFPAKEQVVCRNQSNSCLYIIRHGVALASHKRALRLTGGDYFGEDMLCTTITRPVPRRYTVYSMTFLDVQLLTDLALDQILEGGMVPNTRKLLRRAAFKILFRMTFVSLVHRAVAAINKQQLAKKLDFRLFLSYGRGKASPFARWLKDELEMLGFEVFLDADSIQTGSNWQLAIANALVDCDGVVAVIDKKFAGSIYCKDELTLAKAEGKLVFPILFRDYAFNSLPRDLRFMLASVNGVPFPNETSDAQNVTKLGDAIRKQLLSGPLGAGKVRGTEVKLQKITKDRSQDKICAIQPAQGVDKVTHTAAVDVKQDQNDQHLVEDQNDQNLVELAQLENSVHCSTSTGAISDSDTDSSDPDPDSSDSDTNNESERLRRHTTELGSSGRKKPITLRDRTRGLEIDFPRRHTTELGTSGRKKPISLRDQTRGHDSLRRHTTELGTSGRKKANSEGLQMSPHTTELGSSGRKKPIMLRDPLRDRIRSQENDQASLKRVMSHVLRDRIRGQENDQARLMRASSSPSLKLKSPNSIRFDSTGSDVLSVKSLQLPMGGPTNAASEVDKILAQRFKELQRAMETNLEEISLNLHSKIRAQRRETRQLHTDMRALFAQFQEYNTH